ncbi:hypothetical protein CLV84_1227 [Neolewinella xylanilytica]|uniref:Uncharacterized protein n=1 Tax=Neolewinella xylanilytica TaxID=1514080 RepID=A0A2S6I9V9_9BACT|nr:hypothetical protein CLV84_1227 [Neolewinella xylanilytica]
MTRNKPLHRAHQAKWIPIGLWGIAAVILHFPGVAPAMEIPLFTAACLLVALAGYVRWRSVFGTDGQTRFKSLAGSCILLLTVFLFSDLQLFGERAVMLAGILLLLLLAAYFGWRGRPVLSEQHA